MIRRITIIETVIWRDKKLLSLMRLIIDFDNRLIAVRKGFGSAIPGYYCYNNPNPNPILILTLT